MNEYYDLPYTGAEVAADLAKVHDKESLVEDAPSDGVSYAQSNGEWAESSVDQLGTALDAIKGDETGDDLVGKLKEIVTSKLLIKKALIDADVENVGDVLSAYADMILALAEQRWFVLDLTEFTNRNVLFSYKKAFVHIAYWRIVGKVHHSYVFDGLTTLKSLRHIYTDNTNAAGISFNTCTSLEEVSDFRAPNVTTTKEMFRYCQVLKKATSISAPKSTDAGYMFSGCTALTDVSGLELPNVTDAGYMLQNCRALVKCCLDLSSVTYLYNIFYSCSALRYLLIKNVGRSSMTSWNLSGATNWGVEDETIPLSSGARQSLIDTLITYSYDRATAGMSACSITLSDTTMALLTDTEIAQITAKGFTLS